MRQPVRELCEMGHAPQGECGLKFSDEAFVRSQLEVTPRKGSVD